MHIYLCYSEVIVTSLLLVEQAASCKIPLLIKMNIRFKVLLLLPLVVCTGQPHGERLPPYVSRLGSLMGDIMLFMMYSGSLNYDAYFFTPALMALYEGEFMENGFLDFFKEDFSLREHASDFQFSKTETREQFAKRFFRYIADAENVPTKTREIAAKFAEHFRPRMHDDAKGFIRPFPLYSFVRAVTLFEDQEKLQAMGINNVEVLIWFLVTKFDPKDYKIEDEAFVTDIAAFLGHGFSMSSEPLLLTDGSVASERNKEFFQRLMVEEAVPQDVKNALEAVLAHM